MADADRLGGHIALHHAVDNNGVGHHDGSLHRHACTDIGEYPVLPAEIRGGQQYAQLAQLLIHKVSSASPLSNHRNF